MKKVFELLVLASLISFISCSIPIGVFEKNITIPGQEWASSFRPEISFTIKDTSSLYNIYLVIRHTDAYNYNNIWVRASVIQPGETGSKSGQYDLALASNDKGWYGSAMDDIYETRVLIQPQSQFWRAGEYQFTVEQMMREDPLKHVMNIGVRIEKAN